MSQRRMICLTKRAVKSAVVINLQWLPHLEKKKKKSHLNRFSTSSEKVLFSVHSADWKIPSFKRNCGNVRSYTCSDLL